MYSKSRIGIIGLGYVGLPVAVEFAKKFPGTVGFDINEKKIVELSSGIDRTGEVESSEILKSNLKMTSDIQDLKECNFFIVAVPTPIDSANIPDLTPLIKASETVAKVLKKGDIVVYESTVYPGVTEDICAPILSKFSGLKPLTDFKLGYSPERINPGDKERTLTKIVKVVSGQDAATLKVISETYGSIITAGVYEAKSIKVAEAAKVIENTQRDLNIALVNELAIIFEKMDINTLDVLKAAGTKWNFLPFRPGLVGGHCIGVDPYYLTYRAEELGLHPQVITAGRRINDSMASFIAQKTLKLMLSSGISPLEAKVGVVGLTFKENVTDIRNSKVPQVIKELKEFGINTLNYDPYANADEVAHEYDILTVPESALIDLDVLILAVPHAVFMRENAVRIMSKMKKKSVLVDVKSALTSQQLNTDMIYWSL